MSWGLVFGTLCYSIDKLVIIFTAYSKKDISGGFEGYNLILS